MNGFCGQILLRARLMSAMILCALGATAATAATAQAAGSWGEHGFYSVPTGGAAGQVKTLAATFAGASNGEYFIAEAKATNSLGRVTEYRIQHFVGESAKGEVVFSGAQKVKETGVKGEPVEEIFGSAPVLLAVDSAHHRVYALENFERREANEEEVLKSKFPLDESQKAAGALYAFEYTSAGLKAANGGTALLNAEQLALQSETAGVSILNPRGMAIDPRSGDPVITASQDVQTNAKVLLGESKLCRPAAQYLVPSESAGAVTGAAVGHRFVDGTALKASLMLEEDGGSGECGGELEEGAFEMTPLAPVVTASGRLLAYLCIESGLGPQIWEIGAPTVEEAAKAGTTAAKPRLAYVRPLEVAEHFVFSSEIVGSSEMSLVPEGATETLYVNANYDFLSGQNGAPIVLHLTEPSKSLIFAEVGFTAGAEVLPNAPAPACGLWNAEATPTQLAGLAGNKYLAFSEYRLTPAGFAAEIKEFAEGASTTGCPVEPSLTPSVTDSEGANQTEKIKAGTKATLIDVLANPKDEAKEAGLARSVEWTIKFRLEDGETGETKKTEEYATATSGEVTLPYTFEKPGEYEISAAITTTDLGHPLAKPGSPDKVHVVAAELTLAMHLPVPGEAAAHEAQVELSAGVVPPAGEKLKITSVTWNFGDGSAPHVEKPNTTIEAETTLKEKHAFNLCTGGKCTIELVVEGETEKTPGSKVLYVGKAKAIVKVVKSKLEIKEEEEAKKKAREVQEQKEQKEKQELKEREEREQREAAEAAARKKKEEVEKAEHEVKAYIVSVSPSAISVGSNGAVPIVVTCPAGGSCNGTVVLTITESKKVKKKKKTVTVTIGKGSFSLSGGTETVTLHLSSSLRGQLKRLKHLSVHLTVTSMGMNVAPNVAHTTITLKYKKH